MDDPTAEAPREGLSALLARPMPWAWARGLLPDERRAVVHIRPARLADAEGAEGETLEARARALLVQHLFVDPEDFCPAGDPEFHPDRLVPVFDSPEEVPDCGLLTDAEGTITYAAAGMAMLAALMHASGQPAEATPEAPLSFTDWRKRRRQGREILGLLPQAPDFVLRVRALKLQERRSLEVRGSLGRQPLTWKLARCVVDGDGQPLLTEETALMLPYGAAIHLASACDELDLTASEMPTLHQSAQAVEPEATQAETPEPTASGVE